MIYLILDTNIWLYLANGFNPDTAKHDALHFELLAELKKLKEKGEICILINDIVVEEWKRNKEHSKLKIKQLTNKLDNSNSQFGEIKKYVKSGIGDLKKEYLEGVQNEIAENEKHIQRVEDFLFNDCQMVDISKDLKLKIFDLSTGNKAPFHNKKNNIADASILFSAADFLRGKLWRNENSAIFVSNNFKDFTDQKNVRDFHPDIQGLLDDVDIKYAKVLPNALKLSEKIMLQIEEYHQYEVWLESVSFYCRTPFCEGNENFSPWGYLDQTLKVKYETDAKINPNQQNLFPDLPATKREEKKVGFGDCVICGTLHIECPECDELIYLDDHTEEFNCTECSAKLRIEHGDTGEKYLYVCDKEDDEEE